MGAFSMLLACPTAPARVEISQFTPSSRRFSVRAGQSGDGLKNAGCSVPVRRQSSASRRGLGDFPLAEDASSVENESRKDFGSSDLARTVGVGLIFAAFSVAGIHRAFSSPAFAAPAVAAEYERVEGEKTAIESEVWKKLLEIYGLDERFKKFFDELPEREKSYRATFGVDEALKQLSSVRKTGNETRLGELLAEGKQRIRIESRRLQGKIILQMNSYLTKLRKKENALMKQLDEAMEPFPGLKEKFEAAGEGTDDETEAQISLFSLRTEELRARIKSVKAELLGSEYEGWQKAWREIPAYAKVFEAELEQAMNKYQQPQPQPQPQPNLVTSRIASDLGRTGNKLWEENVLPLAVKMREEQEGVADSELEANVDRMLRNQMQFAGDKQKRALPGIKEKLGTAELYAAFGESFPDSETMLGWRKWCSIKQDELRQHLLENPEAGRQYIQEKQEKLVLARDRVLEQTWYNQERDRWEMSDEAAIYAVDKNLVHHVRIRHDVRILFLALKGDNQEYVVDIKDLDAALEDEGGFDAFYAKLQQNKVPAVMEKMWIPLREWSPLQFVKLPFLLVWDVLQYVWNVDFVATGREIYFDSFMGVVDELWIRFGRPLFGKLPRAVRVFVTLELPKGSEFSEPTFLMKWQQKAQEKFDAREISLPWWMDLPIRGYVIGAPLLLVGTWLAKVVLFLVGPRPLPKTQHRKAIELAKKVYKEMTPLLKQVTTNPIKRVFDKMKRIRKPEVPLKDFVGIESFKEEVDEVVSFLRDPGAYKKLGARPPRGVLIVGETGTGKTTLARAIASEARVPVVELQSFDVQGGGEWVGQKAANVRELFKTARQYAPIILFMDNFHDFVGKRGESGNHNTQELESLINQFLVELDGFETQEGVVVLATTSHPDRIDEALRRPGRMDRTITLLSPNRAQRERMLRLIARDTMFPYVRDFVNWAEVAEKTELYTFVDLQPIPIQLQQAATHWKTKDEEELHAYLYWLDRYNKIVPRWVRNLPVVRSWDQKLIDWLGIRVTKEDMETAVRYMDVYGRSKPGIELHDPDYVWTRETKYPHAIWAAGRGLVALLLPNFDVVDLLWLDETSWEGIAWTRLTRRIEEGYLETDTKTRGYLEKKLVVCYGSHVACNMLLPFMERTDLARPQLQEAQDIANSMVLEFGWALDESPMVYSSKGEGPMNMGYEEVGVLSDKVKKILQLAHDRAAKILSRNKEVLETFIEHLIERQYITQEVMEKILKEKGAIFEEEPFTLQQADTSASMQSTNGTGRSSSALTPSLS